MRRVVLGAVAILAAVVVAACGDSPVQPRTNLRAVDAAPSLELTGADLQACKDAISPDTFDYLCESPTFQAALCQLLAAPGSVTVVYRIGFFTVKATVTTSKADENGNVTVTVVSQTFFGTRLVNTATTTFVVTADQIAKACPKTGT